LFYGCHAKEGVFDWIHPAFISILLDKNLLYFNIIVFWVMIHFILLARQQSLRMHLSLGLIVLP
jgi:hypothetical protein